MTLSFSTQINGEPNYFVEKIWGGLLKENIVKDNYEKYYTKHGEIFRKWWELLPSEITRVDKPKIHTIRTDKKDRWKIGNKIHFVINNRTKNRFQFAPVIPVKSIQKVVIHNHPGINHGLYSFVKVDGYQLSYDEIEILAENDGFESVEDFFAWFSSDFHGKIIHWTDYSYCG